MKVLTFFYKCGIIYIEKRKKKNFWKGSDDMIVEFLIDFEDRLLFDKDCTVVETHYAENGMMGMIL